VDRVYHFGNYCNVIFLARLALTANDQLTITTTSRSLLEVILETQDYSLSVDLTLGFLKSLLVVQERWMGEKKRW